MTEPEPNHVTFADGGPSTTATHTATPAALPTIFPIIAMLAAGNRPALETFCQTLPEEAGMAFIVVTRPTVSDQQPLPIIQESATLPRLLSVDPSLQIDDSFAAQVNEELLRTSERLQAIIDQFAVSAQTLRRSSAELQVINAELKSTTAALATSNEALQSITEELITVKEELTRQLEELAPADSAPPSQPTATQPAQEYAHLEAALQHIPVGVIIAEAPSGRLLWGNAQVERIWRHPYHPAATIEEYRLYQGFHPDGRPYAPHEWPLARAITSGEIVEKEEIAFRRGDGADGVMMVSAAPIRDSAGRITTAVVIFEGVTEQKQAETQLAAHTNLLDYAYDAVIATDTALNVTVWNRGAVAMYGREAREALGRNVTAMTGGTLTPTARAAALQQLTETGYFRLETLTHHRDGTPIWVEGLTVPLRAAHGPITGYLSINRDIRERKQAEADRDLLATLAEQIRLADTADSLAAAVVQLVGDHLQVGRCLWIEVDEARRQGFIRHQYCRDLPPVAVEYQQADYSPTTSAELAAGRVLVNHDAEHDQRTAALYTTVYAPQDERAYIGVPVFRDGVWRGILSVTNVTPRQWQSREVRLLETVAERLWLAIEKLRSEVVLQAAHARTHNILESITDCFYTLSHDWRYTYINTQAERYFGQPRTGMLGQVAWELFPATIGTPFEEHYRKAMTEGNTAHFEVLSPFTHRWVEVHAYPSVDGLAVYFRDISERKAMEAALREREAQLQLITDNVPALISYVDAEERYQFVNAHYTEWFDMPAAAMIGCRVRDLLDAASYAHVQPYLQMAFQGRRVSFENEYPFADGSTRIADVTYVPHLDTEQQVLGIYVLVLDITARKQTEEQVRLLADLGMLFATALDDDVTLQHLAQLLTPRLGDWCAVDMVGPTGELEPVALVHSDPAKVVWAQELRQRYRPHPDGPRGIAKVIRTGQPEWYPEIADELLARAAQDERHLTLLRQIGLQSVIIVPLQARGQTLGALSLGWTTPGRRYGEVDLHFAQELAQRAAMAVDNARLYKESRTAEAQLRTMNEVLEERVRERTADLERSNRELDQFAHIAAHDLKAPLRGILNLAQWIAEDVGASLPAASLAHLQKLQGRARAMERLLDDLLTYARVGRGAGGLEGVQTADLLQEILHLLAPPASFTVTITGEMPVLHTARTPLALVFRNLINNAIKHHHQPAQGVITIHAQALGDFVEFAVSDNGPGIDPQYHARIFDLFQTLHVRKQVEGSGIGLAIVKRAVEYAGGAIAVESSPGAGATFRFTWPNAVTPAEL